MRKSAREVTVRALAAVALITLFPVFARSADPPEVSLPAHNLLAQTLVQRAETETARIRELVAQGTLPRSRLAEAEEHLADLQDEAVLSETLYSPMRLQEMSREQASTMVAAANRRVQRQAKLVEQRKGLVDAGILAQSEFKAFDDELVSRRLVLELAQNRAKLLDELTQMAEAEQRMERAAQRAEGSIPRSVMVRYEGNGLFDLSDLTTISKQFEKQFHRELPVSALGQTMVHRAMGLDHRNRVDVALNPDGPEGLWLRHLLEKLHIPYLAFRSAVAGAATAPHIHIGPGSTRLGFALR